MTIQFKHLLTKHLVVFDLEHDCTELLQLAGLLFTQIGDTDLYKLERNINIYIKQPKITPFIENYTHISLDFLNEHGVTLEEANEMFFSNFLKGVDLSNCYFCSHDISQDKIILKHNNFSLVNCGCGYICTYRLALQCLNRHKNLKLSDVAEECAYTLFDKHNAYRDAWATVAVLSYLLNISEDGK